MTVTLLLLDSVPSPEILLEMQVFLRPLSGKIVATLEVNSSYTVGDVKAQIEEKEGIPKAIQTLVFAAEKLEDEATLADYNIQNNSSIDFLFATSDGMRVFAQDPRGGRLGLLVEGDEKIQMVKKKIEYIEGISVHQMVLSYSGTELQNDRTVAHYNIKARETLEWRKLED